MALTARNVMGLRWRGLTVRGAMATAGSDCHGAFSRREIGCTRTPVSEIDLRGLATETG